MTSLGDYKRTKKIDPIFNPFKMAVAADLNPNLVDFPKRVSRSRGHRELGLGRLLPMGIRHLLKLGERIRELAFRSCVKDAESKCKLVA